MPEMFKFQIDRRNSTLNYLSINIYKTIIHYFFTLTLSELKRSALR